MQLVSVQLRAVWQNTCVRLCSPTKQARPRPSRLPTLSPRSFTTFVSSPRGTVPGSVVTCWQALSSAPVASLPIVGKPRVDLLPGHRLYLVILHALRYFADAPSAHVPFSCCCAPPHKKASPHGCAISSRPNPRGGTGSYRVGSSSKNLLSMVWTALSHGSIPRLCISCSHCLTSGPMLTLLDLWPKATESRPTDPPHREQHTSRRRASRLSIDRRDMRHETKELARHMLDPREIVTVLNAESKPSGVLTLDRYTDSCMLLRLAYTALRVSGARSFPWRLPSCRLCMASSRRFSRRATSATRSTSAVVFDEHHVPQFHDMLDLRAVVVSQDGRNADDSGACPRHRTLGEPLQIRCVGHHTALPPELLEYEPQQPVRLAAGAVATTLREAKRGCRACALST